MEPLSASLEVIRREWNTRSRDLAQWTMERLVNRFDAWGQYTGAKDRYHRAVTLPQPDLRGKDVVTLSKVARHYRSQKRSHLIGVHAVSEDQRSLWLAIDIDLHDAHATEAKEISRRNFFAAQHWWQALQDLGHDPLLFDSNGVGGFHLWVLFDRPVPTSRVYAFGQHVIGNWKALGLPKRPETFPKTPHLTPGKLGAWLRLPGLHHTRDHFTRVWSGDAWLDAPWQEGSAAIDVILNTVPRPAPNWKPNQTSSASLVHHNRARSGHNRPVICLDLDGVLAHHDKWRGDRYFGRPIQGAVDFTHRLSKWARIVISSARVDVATNEARDAIRQWLEVHGFAYDDVAAGKPLAHAYVDDRAIRCTPQTDGPAAYEAAELDLKILCGRTQQKKSDVLPELVRLWPALRPEVRTRLLFEARKSLTISLTE